MRRLMRQSPMIPISGDMAMGEIFPLAIQPFRERMELSRNADRDIVLNVIGCNARSRGDES
jgi:hypothetical protein